MKYVITIEKNGELLDKRNDGYVMFLNYFDVIPQSMTIERKKLERKIFNQTVISDTIRRYVIWSIMDILHRSNYVHEINHRTRNWCFQN